MQFFPAFPTLARPAFKSAVDASTGSPGELFEQTIDTALRGGHRPGSPGVPPTEPVEHQETAAGREGADFVPLVALGLLGSRDDLVPSSESEESSILSAAGGRAHPVEVARGVQQEEAGVQTMGREESTNTQAAPKQVHRTPDAQSKAGATAGESTPVRAEGASETVPFRPAAPLSGVPMPQALHDAGARAARAAWSPGQPVAAAESERSNGIEVEVPTPAGRVVVRVEGQLPSGAAPPAPTAAGHSAATESNDPDRPAALPDRDAWFVSRRTSPSVEGADPATPPTSRRSEVSAPKPIAGSPAARAPESEDVRPSAPAVATSGAAQETRGPEAPMTRPLVPASEPETVTARPAVRESEAATMHPVARESKATLPRPATPEPQPSPRDPITLEQAPSTRRSEASVRDQATPGSAPMARFSDLTTSEPAGRPRVGWDTVPTARGTGTPSPERAPLGSRMRAPEAPIRPEPSPRTSGAGAPDLPAARPMRFAASGHVAGTRSSMAPTEADIPSPAAPAPGKGTSAGGQMQAPSPPTSPDVDAPARATGGARPLGRVALPVESVTLSRSAPPPALVPNDPVPVAVHLPRAEASNVILPPEPMTPPPRTSPSPDPVFPAAEESSLGPAEDFTYPTRGATPPPSISPARTGEGSDSAGVPWWVRQPGRGGERVGGAILQPVTTTDSEQPGSGKPEGDIPRWPIQELTEEPAPRPSHPRVTTTVSGEIARSPGAHTPVTGPSAPEAGASVGRSALPAPPSPPAVNAQAAYWLRVSLRSNRRESVITLDPPDLGRMRISIRREGPGITARITAELPEVEAVLREGAAAIRERLTHQGLRIDHLVIEPAPTSSPRPSPSGLPQGSTPDLGGRAWGGEGQGASPQGDSGSGGRPAPRQTTPQPPPLPGEETPSPRPARRRVGVDVRA